MEKVIYRSFEKCCVINKHNKVIKKLISENYILDDINFDNLPSNIFNNIPLYLGDKYQTLDINIFQFKKLLLTNIQIELDKSYWNYNLYSSSIKKKFVYYGVDKIFFIRDFKYLKELLKYTNKELSLP